MSDELEPCRFCEREPEFQEFGGGYIVTCTHCDIRGEWGDYGYQAADKWNAAAKAIEASGQDRNGLDAKHESAVAKPFAEKEAPHE